MAEIKIIQGDITHFEGDAIVNAANNSLLGGGGVDGAVHRAAGPELLAACRKLNGCKTGEAKITSGFRLTARYVIHAVGPVWKGGGVDEATLLANCYRNSLQIAATYHLHSIVFPAISTGIYGYPFEAASIIAIQTAQAFIQSNTLPDKIIFMLYSRQHYETFLALYKSMVT